MNLTTTVYLIPPNGTTIWAETVGETMNFSTTQKQRKENAEVVNGHLFVRAIKEKYEGNEYTSARLVTRGKMDFRYGKIEIRARLPKGRGVWAAFWMLSSKEPRVWPDDGEGLSKKYVL
jgi:beta-glucanase (GH16 family)